MPDLVRWYRGDNGDVLVVLESTEDNTGVIYSIDRDVYYTPEIQTVGEGSEGIPMGLLLTITYPA